MQGIQSFHVPFKAFLRAPFYLAAIYVLFWLEAIRVWFYPIYRKLTAYKESLYVRTPSNAFAGLEKLGFNFRSHWFHVPFIGQAPVNAPRMHFVDEGPAAAEKVVLCLHGELGWGFEFRRIITKLSGKGYRVVVPDLIGFGKSDKYAAVENYTHEVHAACIRSLLEKLNLKNVTLIGHGWGGIIGLSVVKDMPNTFSSLVLMNTGVPIGSFTDENLGIEFRFGWNISKLKYLPNRTVQFVAMLPLYVWRLYVKVWGKRMPVGRILKSLSVPHEAIPGYEAPYPEARYKAGLAALPRMFPVYVDSVVSPHMREARNYLMTWKKPALLIFGGQDLWYWPYLPIFKNMLPMAESLVVERGGHFLLETDAKDIESKLCEFLDTNC